MSEELTMERTPKPATPEAYFFSGLGRLFGMDQVGGGIVHAEGASFAALARWLLTVTDAEGAEGVSLEAGREAFDLLLRDRGEEIGLQDPAIRMLPMRRRARKGFEALAAWFERTWGWESSVTSQPTTLSFELKSPGGSAGREVQHSFCYFVEGLLQGLLFWASGGRYYEPLSLKPQPGSQFVCEFSFSNTPID
ncbi:hypothetical protein EG834_00495 [bacterium]|nr:hypothetical protein [bacterium]